MDIKGKVAVITGAANGIGMAYVKALLKNGLKGVAIGDLDEKQGQKLIQEINTEYGSNTAIFVKTDVTKSEELENFFKAASNSFKTFDIVINNAGIMNDGKWELEIDLNVIALTRGTLLALDYMGKEKGGKGGVVVNIASILGLQEFAGCPIYAGTKHYVIGLTRSFGTPFHFDKSGIRFLTMCPGVTDTPLISEAGWKQLETDVGAECARGLAALPKQPTENVAKGLITMITRGENGSVWVSEGNALIYEVVIPDRLTLRKN